MKGHCPIQGRTMTAIFHMAVQYYTPAQEARERPAKVLPGMRSRNEPNMNMSTETR